MTCVVPPRAARLRSCGLAVVLLPCLALAAHAQGSPRSMADCERLKNDLAYNQCLAMFGPPAKNVATGDGGLASAPITSVPAPASTSVAGIPSVEEPELETRGRRGRRGRHARRGGRQSAVFAVATAAEAGDAAPTRRSRRRRHR